MGDISLCILLNQCALAWVSGNFVKLFNATEITVIHVLMTKRRKTCLSPPNAWTFGIVLELFEKELAWTFCWDLATLPTQHTLLYTDCKQTATWPSNQANEKKMPEIKTTHLPFRRLWSYIFAVKFSMSVNRGGKIHHRKLFFHPVYNSLINQKVTWLHLFLPTVQT